VHAGAAAIARQAIQLGCPLEADGEWQREGLVGDEGANAVSQPFVPREQLRSVRRNAIL
jgi:hypothetical protein